MRRLGSLAFNLVLVSMGLVLSLWCFVSFRHRRADGVLAVAKVWTGISLAALRLFCGISFEIEGRLPEGRVILAAQHQSELDVLIWIMRLRRPAFVFKRELARIPLFGKLLEPGGMVPVDRGGGAAALQSMVQGCTAALAKGHQVVIFPEGTRTAPGNRANLRNGVVALAKASGAPVVPVATDTGLYWGKSYWRRNAGVARVKIYPALSSGMEREEIMHALSEIFYEKGVG